MFRNLKKFVRGSKGMEALQAVLLIGGGFVVVWGLMTLWTGVIQPLVETNVSNTVNGTPQAGEAGAAAPGGVAAPGAGKPAPGGAAPGAGKPGKK